MRKLRNVLVKSLLTATAIFSNCESSFAQQYQKIEPQKQEKKDKTEEKNYFIGLHGINQTWDSNQHWNSLEQRVEQNTKNKVEFVGINLPNRGLSGWEQNKAEIDAKLMKIEEINGKIGGFFGYSLGGVTELRYLEENPELISKNNGGTLFLLDPAIKSSLGEFLISTPMKPAAAGLFQRITPTQTHLELTRKDNEKFLEKTHQGVDILAENFAKNNWKVILINLNSEIVDGSAINNLASTFRSHNVHTEVYTPDDIANKYTLPTRGNKGIFRGGLDLPWASVKEYTRENAVHAYWGPTLRESLNSFITEKITDTTQNNNVNHGGIDFRNITLNYITEDTLRNHHFFGYAFKGTVKTPEMGQQFRLKESGWVSVDEMVDMQNSCRLSLESFLNWVTLPNNLFWVNLNPSEPDRIVDDRLRKTDLGEILLRADLDFKKEFAGITDPRISPIGKEFWNKLYNEAKKRSDDQLSVNYRIWAVPGKNDVYANDQEIYIKEARIKLMLESDYLSTHNIRSGFKNELTKYAEDLAKKIVIPEIEKRVNEDIKFADLKQVYFSRVLAAWYESKFPSGTGMFSAPLEFSQVKNPRIDERLIEGFRTWDPREIFDAYVNSYKQGEYNFTEQEYSGNYITTKKYFMGGVDFTNVELNVLDTKVPEDIKRNLFEAMFDPLGSENVAEIAVPWEVEKIRPTIRVPEYFFGGFIISKD